MPSGLRRWLSSAVLVAGMAGGVAEAASISYYLNQTNANPQMADGVNYLKVTLSDSTFNLDTAAIRFDVQILGPLTSLLPVTSVSSPSASTPL